MLHRSMSLSQSQAPAASQHFGSHWFERQELGSRSMNLERALDDG